MKISRQYPFGLSDCLSIRKGKYRCYLLLELMIALVLIVLCAIPLAELPMQAMKEEFKSVYRMQAERLADLGASIIKEKLYKEEIPWKEIVRSAEEKVSLPSDTVEIAFKSLGKRTFLREYTLHSSYKKEKNGQEWYLVTIRIKITPEQKGMKLFRTKKSSRESRLFSYRALLKKKDPTTNSAVVEGANIQEPSKG